MTETNSNPYPNPPRWLPTVIRQHLAFRQFDGDTLKAHCEVLASRKMGNDGIFNTADLYAFVLFARFYEKARKSGDGIMWLAWEALHNCHSGAGSVY
ncbi:MAG: hypothetical protein ACPG7F_00270 [Aggregatilineales bacterium]